MRDRCALAYRQCFAAGKFVADANGQPLQFCKENHSNGCIGTSDVFYPMAPQFLLFGPTLAKSFLVPFMEYAASERWRFPFAPHDLGPYPHANGQRYGGGERSEENQMPVEESGNLLLLMAAVAQMEGQRRFCRAVLDAAAAVGRVPEGEGIRSGKPTLHGRFRRPPGPQREPECQGDLCAWGVREAVRDARRARPGGRVHRTGQAVSPHAGSRRPTTAIISGWPSTAPGTWSQKYNLVWDRILGLDCFRMRCVARRWTITGRCRTTTGCRWTTGGLHQAGLGLVDGDLTQDRDDFEALVDPVCGS